MSKSNLLSLVVSLAVLAGVLTGCAIPAPQAEAPEQIQTVNVAGLKGPTTIGLVHMMDRSKGDESKSSNKYNFSMYVSADEILPLVVSGEVDIALIPANVAAVLYNKTQGGVSVIDINTLGVLYGVSRDESVGSISDLSGKKIYMTGKGTIPDFTLQYLLKENDITDVTVEFKSEPTEVAALIKEDSEAVGILPQPFVTTLCAQNDSVKTVLSLCDEWDKLNNDSRMITGVTIVRNDFAKENPEAVRQFMEDHKESAQLAMDDVEKTGELVADAGIIPNPVLASKAIPDCNITYIDGAEQKSLLQGYLKAIFDFDAKLLGGSIPGDDFYYE